MLDKKHIVIVVDTNDADYNTTIIKYVNEEFEQLLRRVAKAIETVKNNSKNKWYHNWPLSEYSDGNVHELYGEYLTEEEIMWICDEIHQETHTIDKISILHVREEEKLL